MRKDMEKHRPQRDVLTYIDTLQAEEQKARWRTELQKSQERGRQEAADRQQAPEPEIELGW